MVNKIDYVAVTAQSPTIWRVDSRTRSALSEQPGSRWIDYLLTCYMMEGITPSFLSLIDNGLVASARCDAGRSYRSG